MLAMVTGSIRFVLSRDSARRQRSPRLTAAAAIFAGFLCQQSLALAQQTPFVPDESKFGKRQDGAALNYCVDERDPDLPVAKEIGRAVAQALLLQPKEHAIGQNTAGEDIDNLYRVFLETCDVYLGFKLISDAYPPWLAITRPYYRTSYVLATTDAGWKSLADMPKSNAIGATIGTSADIRLIQYLQALPAEQRWSRFPMGSDELALHALMRGTVSVALVWGPSFWALQKTDPALADLRLISLKPLPESVVGVGATLLANETFLRSSVDDAIASLVADGSIGAILDRNKFPATPAK
jgi:polar amino acid transport system substrate-binding protein